MLEVELVLADGTIMTANAEQNPDLFWAVRGGGGNFGVAVSFLYRLHAVGPEVTGGLVIHQREDASALLHFLAEVAPTLPDEVGAIGGLIKSPDGSGTNLAVIATCHCGDAAAAQADLRPMKEFGTPVADEVGPIKFSEMNTLLDAANPAGTLNYWKSAFIEDLSEEVIERLIESFDRGPSPMGFILFEYVHGAVCRVAPDETAFPHRQPGYNVVIISQWLDPADTPACVAWAREAFDAIAPFDVGSRYINYLSDDDLGDTVRAAYGSNYARLQRIKARYDPDNVFHVNQNIAPAD